MLLLKAWVDIEEQIVNSLGKLPRFSVARVAKSSTVFSGPAKNLLAPVSRTRIALVRGNTAKKTRYKKIISEIISFVRSFSVYPGLL